MRQKKTGMPPNVAANHQNLNANKNTANTGFGHHNNAPNVGNTCVNISP